MHPVSDLALAGPELGLTPGHRLWLGFPQAGGWLAPLVARYLAVLQDYPYRYIYIYIHMCKFCPPLPPPLSGLFIQVQSELLPY